MDSKCKVIDNILLKYNNNMKIEDLRLLLYSELKGYKIEKENYEVATVNNNEILLKNFYGTKKLEGLSNKSLEQYLFTNRKFLISINKNALDVTKSDILCYLYNYQSERKISNTTLQNMIRYMNTFYQWLEDNDYIQKSPMKTIKVPKTEKVIKYPFTSEEMEKMRNSVNNKRDRALIEFMYATGCRVSEIENMDINDVDLTKNIALVKKAKGNKERVVFLSDKSNYYLREYLNSRNDDNEALFVHNKGNKKRLSKYGIENLVHKLGAELNFKAYPHKFRRSFATKAIKHNMKIQNLSQLMGHSKVDTTMIYCNISKSELQYNHNVCMN